MPAPIELRYNPPALCLCASMLSLGFIRVAIDKRKGRGVGVAFDRCEYTVGGMADGRNEIFNAGWLLQLLYNRSLGYFVEILT